MTSSTRQPRGSGSRRRAGRPAPGGAAYPAPRPSRQPMPRQSYRPASAKRPAKPQRRARKPHTIDMPTMCATLLLLLVGLIALFSASYSNALYTQGSATYFIARQLKWAAGGLIAMFLLSKWDNHDYKYLTAENGNSAILEASSHNPDIVLLDLGLPDMEGVDVIKNIRTWSNMPIIVISARSEDADKIEALDAGADDYITKPFSVEELLARIRVTQRRLAMIQSDENQESSVFINGQLKIDYTAGCTYLNGTELHLTPIEYKLLCLLSRNVGKVLTHTYITQQIWGSSLENDIASLRVFMATLRKKLEVSQNDIQYIQTHIGIGYRMLKIE